MDGESELSFQATDCGEKTKSRRSKANKGERARKRDGGARSRAD